MSGDGSRIALSMPRNWGSQTNILNYLSCNWGMISFSKLRLMDGRGRLFVVLGYFFFVSQNFERSGISHGIKNLVRLKEKKKSRWKRYEDGDTKMFTRYKSFSFGLFITSGSSSRKAFGVEGYRDHPFDFQSLVRSYRTNLCIFGEVKNFTF